MMGSRRGAVYLALAALTTVPGRSQESGPPLTLEQAIEFALENNRGLGGARSRVDQAEHGESVARSHLAPQIDVFALGSLLLTDLDFTFQEGVFGSFPGVGAVPPSDAIVRTDAGTFTTWVVTSVRQPLSQLPRIQKGIRIAELESGLAEAAVRLESQGVRGRVRAAYFGLLETRSGLSAVAESLKFLTELERIVSANVAEGTALEVDRLEVSAQAAMTRYRQQALEAADRDLHGELNRLMGRDLDTPFRVIDRDELPTEWDSEGRDLETSLAARPDLEARRLELEKARLERSVGVHVLPDVSFSLDYFSAGNVEILPSNFAQAGFLVTWEPSSLFRRKAEGAILDSRIDQAASQVVEAEALARQEIDMVTRRLASAHTLVGASELRVRAAKERRRVELERFEEQRSQLRDLLETEADLAAAEDEYRRARIGVWLARLELERATGVMGQE